MLTNNKITVYGIGTLEILDHFNDIILSKDGIDVMDTTDGEVLVVGDPTMATLDLLCDLRISKVLCNYPEKLDEKVKQFSLTPDFTGKLYVGIVEGELINKRFGETHQINIYENK